MPEKPLRRSLPFLVAVALVGAAACGDDDDAEPRSHSAEAYEAVVRALAPDPPGEEVEELDHAVYVGPINDDVSISLDTQAAVVSELDDFATIRFVDDREEAISSDDAESVKDDGVLVLVGRVPPGLSPTVRALRYVDVDDSDRYRVAVRGTEDDEMWSVVELERLGAP